MLYLLQYLFNHWVTTLICGFIIWVFISWAWDQIKSDFKKRNDKKDNRICLYPPLLSFLYLLIKSSENNSEDSTCTLCSYPEDSDDAEETPLRKWVLKRPDNLPRH